VEAIDLYQHIPKGHFYEQLDKVLELEFGYELTRPLYADKLGRPSLDPEARIVTGTLISLTAWTPR
jgi:hypothetical protein